MMKRSGAVEQREPEHPSDYCSIRDLLVDKPAHEIRHELPKLIETVAEQSQVSEANVRFIIGVSFTTNGSCFDYWIDEVRRQDDVETYRVEELKGAISPDHPYVTFVYPPDPYFDASTLRGCLLSTVEEELALEATEEARSPGLLARCVSVFRR